MNNDIGSAHFCAIDAWSTVLQGRCNFMMGFFLTYNWPMALSKVIMLEAPPLIPVVTCYCTVWSTSAACQFFGSQVNVAWIIFSWADDPLELLLSIWQAPHHTKQPSSIPSFSLYTTEESSGYVVSSRNRRSLFLCPSSTRRAEHGVS